MKQTVEQTTNAREAWVEMVAPCTLQYSRGYVNCDKRDGKERPISCGSPSTRILDSVAVEYE